MLLFNNFMNASLSEIIRARRIVRGLERRDLAEAVGCDIRTVRRWESGSRPLTRHMPALREALDLSLEEMDHIVLGMVRERSSGLRIEGPEFLWTRNLSYDWLLDTLLAADRRLVDCDATLGVHDPSQWVPIFEALPDTWRLLTHGDQIVGNWQFLPLSPGIHDEICAARVTDADIRLDHLVSLDLPGEFDLHITALVVEPAFRQGQGLVMLLRAICERLCDLARRGVHFRRIGAIAWKPQSILLCRRLGMKPMASIGNKNGVFFESTINKLTDPVGISDFSRLKAIYSSDEGPNFAFV